MKYLIILQTIIILFIPFQILAQDSSKKITYQKQIKIALSGIVYDHLHLNHEGRKLLKSAPMPSGDISISFYQHIHHGLGLVIGIGATITPTNLHFQFDSPKNSIFRTNEFYDYKKLDFFISNYDGQMFHLPLSIQKTLVPLHKNPRVVELGIRMNILNYDPEYLPYSYSFGSSYQIGSYGQSARLFNSEIHTVGSIFAVSAFTKYGWQKMLDNEHTLEYKFVANWSPKKIAKGTFDFENLGYTSKGTMYQTINYLGFEISYGLTTKCRLDTQ